VNYKHLWYFSILLLSISQNVDSSSLPGIYKAVHTMRLNEESQFLISYKDLFGKLGCLPRIPPESDALYIMKVRSFSEMGDVNALDELPESERNDFATVHKKALEVLKSGLEMFKKGNHGQAIRAFLKSARGLELCRLKDEAEQMQQTATLIRLYTNLAVCYNKSEMYRKTCLITQDIKRLCDIQQKSKVLFCEGRAQRMLGNYQLARNALDQCQRLAPKDPAVAMELVKLNDQCKKYAEENKRFNFQMFRNLNFADKPTNAKEPAKDDTGDADKETIGNFLTQFLTSDARQLRLQEALTESEAESMRNMLVGPFEAIDLATTYIGDRKINTLVKKR
jgi:FK506-binding protein 6